MLKLSDNLPANISGPESLSGAKMLQNLLCPECGKAKLQVLTGIVSASASGPVDPTIRAQNIALSGNACAFAQCVDCGFQATCHAPMTGPAFDTSNILQSFDSLVRHRMADLRLENVRGGQRRLEFKPENPE